MRIHTDKIELRHIHAAMSEAQVSPIRLTLHGSRSRDHAFDVKLTGLSNRRCNGDTDEYAATWDQWGVFLGALYQMDPDMKVPYYDSRDHFNYVTDYRFDTEEERQEIALAHDHHWEFVAPRTFQCANCDALRYS